MIKTLKVCPSFTPWYPNRKCKENNALTGCKEKFETENDEETCVFWKKYCKNIIPGRMFEETNRDIRFQRVLLFKNPSFLSLKETIRVTEISAKTAKFAMP